MQIPTSKPFTLKSDYCHFKMLPQFRNFGFDRSAIIKLRNII